MQNGWTPYIHKELVEHGALRWLHEQYSVLEGQMCPSDKSEVFRAFKLTPYEQVRVVIIGQDPYHTPGVADGLAFSSKKQDKIPPSLRNIFKAIKNDLGIENKNPSLDKWASQGVLLLNTALTTIVGSPLEHAEYWKDFTSSVLSALNNHPNNLVFLLWGNEAKKLSGQINSKHTVLTASHPSPLSAKNFINCQHFSKVNEILTTPIDWRTDV